MKTNDNFAYDLQVGQHGENIFADLLTGKKNRSQNRLHCITNGQLVC